VVVAFHYSVLSMYASGMIFLGSTGQPASAYFVSGNGATFWWNYPAFVVFWPGGLVAFPLWLTLGMGLVAIGLGYAVAAATNVLWASHPLGRGDPAGPKLPAGAVTAPVLAALGSLATGCGADFAVGGLALIGGSAEAARQALGGFALAFAVVDLLAISASLALLERALNPVVRPPDPHRTGRSSASRRLRRAPVPRSGRATAEPAQ